MLEAIVIHRSFPRQLASLLSLLLLIFTVTTARALETPPNLRWQRATTSATTATAHPTHCKLLSNGNLAISGLFTGTGPILGAPHQVGQEPTQGAFVALQSSSGELLWLHRFTGLASAQLETDSQDNIYLASYAQAGVSLLGTNLSAEPDTLLVYALSLKADGTLNHLRRLGQLEDSANPLYAFLETRSQPINGGLLVSLEFQGTLQVGGTAYSTPEGWSGLRFKITDENDIAWAHHAIGTDNVLGPLLSLPAGGYLGFINFYISGSFQGQTYEDHCLLVWWNESGEVTQIARLTGGLNAHISGAALAANGDIILQVVASGDVTIETPGGPTLQINVAEPGEGPDSNVTIARIAGDLSAVHWQIGTEMSAQALTNLQLDQAGNIYAALSIVSLGAKFDGIFMKPTTIYDYFSTIMVKLAPSGQLLWYRYDKSAGVTGYAVNAAGVSYLVSRTIFFENPGRIVSFAASFETSPPESSEEILTDKIVATGSKLYFSQPATRPSGTVYYLYRDGVAITNQTTSPLVIENVSSADLGSYTVIASNQFGTATSGPYTFKLGPPSKLAGAELLQHIKTPSLMGLWTYFSPDGRYHLCTFGSQSEFELNSAIYPAIPYRLYCQTAARGDTPRVFPIDYPTNALFPSALIANDGSCFFMASYRAGPANQQYSRHWLRRTDSTGNTLWELDVASATSWQFHGMSIHQNTNLVLLAYCKQGTALGTHPPVTQSGLYLVRISFAGEVLDTKLLLLGEDLYAGMYLASDGSGYLRTTSPATIPGGETVPAVAGHFHLLRFDADGQINWFRRLPQPDEYNMAIANDADGVVLGITYRDQVEVSGLPALNFQDQGVLVIRWSKDGHLEWHKVLDTPGWDYVRALDVDAGGNVIFGLMTTNEFTMDGLTVPANPQNFEQPVLVTLSRAGIMSDALRLSASGPLVISDLAIDPTGRVLFSGGIAMYTSQPNLFQMGPYTALQNYPWLGGYYAMTGPMGPPLLMRQESGELKLNWSEHLPGYALESSPSPTGPWAPVTTSTNSITLEAGTSGSQFFRLKQQSE